MLFESCVRNLGTAGGTDPCESQLHHTHVGIDETGFDENDKKLIKTIIEKFSGGPVGVATLAAAISEEVDAIEDIYEPYLIQRGFLHRTPRGRVATKLAYEHFGLTQLSDQLNLL